MKKHPLLHFFKKNKSPLPFLILLFLIIALPFLLWTVITKRQDIRERAQTITSVCVPDTNKIIQVTPEGSSGTCHDVQTAIDAVPDEDPTVTTGANTNFTIELSPGTYTVPAPIDPYNVYEALRIQNKSQLAITSSTRSRDDVTIQFAQSQLPITAIYILSSSGRIEHLTINGNNSVSSININQSPDFRVQFSRIVNQGTAASIGISNSNNITIEGSEIEADAGRAIEILDSIQPGQPDAIAVHIVENEIRNSKDGIFDRDSAVGIYANFIHDNSNSAISFDRPLFTQIVNNTILENSHDNPLPQPGAIIISNLSQNQPIIEFQKNVISNNTGGVVLYSYQSWADPELRFTDNDVWQNGSNYSGTPDPTGTRGNISADPLFGPDYCLLPNSPAILNESSTFTWMGHKGPCASNSPSPSASPTANMKRYFAVLNPDSSVNSSASGTFVMTLNEQTNYYDGYLYLKNMSMADLTQAHIHFGAAGVNGPIIVDLLNAGGGSYAPFEQYGGIIKLVYQQLFPAAYLTNLDDQTLYVNVHTRQNPNGEIRGQLVSGFYQETPPAQPNPVSWITPTVSLTADDFYLLIQGQKFYANNPTVRVVSDPGNTNYTTLEVSWVENGVEMRVYIYFKSLNGEWWAYEMRTYDNQPHGNWITYFSDVINPSQVYLSPLNTPFMRSDEFIHNMPTDEFSGEVHFKNLRLLAFVVNNISPSPSSLTGFQFKVRFNGVTQSRPDQTVTVTLLQNGTPVNTFTNVAVQSDTQGTYTNINSLTGIASGTYDIAIKGPAHLTHTFKNMDVSTSTTLDLTQPELIAGDSIQSGNSADIIDVADYNLLVTDFGPRFPAGGSKADFNFDGDVDIYDYSMFVTNFDLRGD